MTACIQVKTSPSNSNTSCHPMHTSLIFPTIIFRLLLYMYHHYYHVMHYKIGCKSYLKFVIFSVIFRSWEEMQAIEVKDQVEELMDVEQVLLGMGHVLTVGDSKGKTTWWNLCSKCSFNLWLIFNVYLSMSMSCLIRVYEFSLFVWSNDKDRIWWTTLWVYI